MVRNPNGADLCRVLQCDPKTDMILCTIYCCSSEPIVRSDRDSRKGAHAEANFATYVPGMYIWETTCLAQLGGAATRVRSFFCIGAFTPLRVRIKLLARRPGLANLSGRRN